jgi:hypothetical protein
MRTDEDDASAPVVADALRPISNAQWMQIKKLIRNADEASYLPHYDELKLREAAAGAAADRVERPLPVPLRQWFELLVVAAAKGRALRGSHRAFLKQLRDDKTRELTHVRALEELRPDKAKHHQLAEWRRQLEAELRETPAPGDGRKANATKDGEIIMIKELLAWWDQRGGERPKVTADFLLLAMRPAFPDLTLKAVRSRLQRIRAAQGAVKRRRRDFKQTR